MGSQEEKSCLDSSSSSSSSSSSFKEANHSSSSFKRAPHGPYWFHGGFSLPAACAVVLGTMPSVPGFLYELGAVSEIPPIFSSLYDYAWFIGIAVAFLIHWFVWTLCSRCQSVYRMPTRTLFEAHSPLPFDTAAFEKPGDPDLV